MTVLAHAQQHDIQSADCLDELGIGRGRRLGSQLGGDRVLVRGGRVDFRPQVLLHQGVVALRMAGRVAAFITEVPVDPVPGQGQLRQQFQAARRGTAARQGDMAERLPRQAVLDAVIQIVGRGPGQRGVGRG